MEEPAELPKLECALRDMDLEDTPKTVGDLFELKCSGIMEMPLSEKTQIRFAEEGSEYALYITQVTKIDTSEFVAEVTSYLPSVYAEKSFILADGEAEYQVDGLSWSFESILEEAEQHQKETIEPPPEKLEPYPFFGPVSMSYPMWVWVALALIASFFGILVLRWLRKRSQKKSLINAALSGMGSALTPYQDFNKSLRQILRKNSQKNMESQNVMMDLDQAFRAYLTRALTVPAFDWSESEIIRDIRKYHRPVYQDNGRSILQILREFDRAKGQSIAKQDIIQLTELSRKTVEGIDRYKVKRMKTKGSAV